MKQKKIPKRYLQNLDTKINNIREIYYLVKEEKYTQSEIITKTKLSRPTVKAHLEMMIEKKMIETKEIVNPNQQKKVIYVLMTINPAKIKSFETYLETLTNNDSAVFGDYSELGIILNVCSLPWGINTHLMINPELKRLELLKRDDVEEIERLLYEKIRNNIKHVDDHKMKFREQSLKLLDDDTFSINFSIDLTNVHKSIEEKSLEMFDNMTDEEISSKFEFQSDEELDWAAEHEDELDLVQVKE